MGDGRWEMGDGRWEIGDGRWEMGVQLLSSFLLSPEMADGGILILLCNVRSSELV